MDAINFGKRLVEKGDLTVLQEGFRILQECENVDWPYLFQKVYLHACLKGQRGIAEWLQNTVFPTLDPIQQIALRQCFAYGRYLLQTAERRKEMK